MQQGPYYGSPSISNQDLWTGSRSVADFQLRGLTAWGDYFFVVSNYTDTAVGPFIVSWVF